MVITSNRKILGHFLPKATGCPRPPSRKAEEEAALVKNIGIDRKAAHKNSCHHWFP